MKSFKIKVALFFAIVEAVKIGQTKVGGIIVLGLVWEKIRPIIVIQTQNQIDYYFGISHSTKRKNMKPLTPDGVFGIEITENSYFSLCNKPSEIYNQIGYITHQKAQEIIDQTQAKKIDKKLNRKKN